MTDAMPVGERQVNAPRRAVVDPPARSAGLRKNLFSQLGQQPSSRSCWRVLLSAGAVVAS